MKSQTKKLSLNKRTISNLNANQMSVFVGGKTNNGCGSAETGGGTLTSGNTYSCATCLLCSANCTVTCNGHTCNGNHC